MPKRRVGNLPRPKRAKGEEALFTDEGAIPRAVPEAPLSSLSHTAPVLDDVQALGDLNVVNLLDLEKRIGLLTRIIIEAALRAPRASISLKEKADVALRAITVLEGSKQQVLWRDEMLKKPTPKSVEEYEKEMRERESTLTELLLRRKELRARQVENALDAIQQEEDEDSSLH